MNIVLGLLLMFTNSGVTINAHDLRIDVVRTDQQPASEHHQILDRPEYARLRPFTVTIKTKGQAAIQAITVVFDVVDANGKSHSFPMFYHGPLDGKFAVVFPGSSTSFWPGGRVMTTPPPYRPPDSKPLMNKPTDATMDMLENAKSVSFSVPYIEFSDGTIVDAGGFAAKAAASRQRTSASRARRGLQ